MNTFDPMRVEIESSWQEILKNEFGAPYFSQLVEFVRSEYAQHKGGVFPPGPQIFRAFEACPFEKVKVVILGQDPYPTKGHAHGLSFSVDSSVRPLPKSLHNIYTELNDDLNVQRANGDLSSWAKQGVLMLNAVLTVREGQPGSHANKGWERFTDAVIQQIGTRKEHVVYILWGSYAQKKGTQINTQNNLVINTPHPSPLSAYRGFFGSKPFSQTNAYLQEHNIEPINW